MNVCMHEIPIVGMDKATWAFLDADGNRYYEVDHDVFIREGVMVGGAVPEGSLGFHGSGSHGGRIVLKPFYTCVGGVWQCIKCR